MENEDVIKKINDIEQITDSQKDRFNSQVLIQEELFNFLINQMKVENAEKDLKNSLLNEFKEKLENKDDDEEFPLTNAQKIKLVEILFKRENEKNANILNNVMKDKQNLVLNVGQDKNNDSSLNIKEINEAKKMIDVFDLIKKMKNSEMSLEELENKKNIENL